MVAMDYFSNWPEVVRTPNQEATTITEALLENVIVRLHVPFDLSFWYILKVLIKSNAILPGDSVNRNLNYFGVSNSNKYISFRFIHIFRQKRRKFEILAWMFKSLYLEWVWRSFFIRKKPFGHYCSYRYLEYWGFSPIR